MIDDLTQEEIAVAVQVMEMVLDNASMWKHVPKEDRDAFRSGMKKLAWEWAKA